MDTTVDRHSQRGVNVQGEQRFTSSMVVTPPAAVIS